MNLVWTSRTASSTEVVLVVGSGSVLVVVDEEVAVVGAVVGEPELVGATPSPPASPPPVQPAPTMIRLAATVATVPYLCQGIPIFNLVSTLIETGEMGT